MESVSTRIGQRELVIETGRIARQAAGSVTIRLGDTVVLSAVTASKHDRPDVDFLPLAVDYREYFYAAGRIPGGFFKREGRPNEKEILTCRLIDRPLRPLFPSRWRRETQVTCLLLSTDRENDSDVLALTAAATALGISDLPFDTSLAAVRVGLVDGEFVLFPTFAQLDESLLNLVVAGSDDAIMMVEAGAEDLPENKMVEALAFAHEGIREIVAMQKDLVARIAPKKQVVVADEPDPALAEQISEGFRDRMKAALETPGKLDAAAAKDEVRGEILESLSDRPELDRTQVSSIVKGLEEDILRRAALDDGRRLDGRAFDEIRPITCDVGFLPRAHGSAVFTRGETQALVTTTLAPVSEAQRLDWVHAAGEKRFLLHYNFPAFCVGEARMMRGPGRREIGHGALAERALLPAIPDENEFNYAIRVVSDTLESNGSSSMAAVTGGCLSLMDAGVPLKAPIAGIAMGLITEGDTYRILTDIAGAEDHFGDMDFKVAGTASGITALQMDIKVAGLPLEVMEQALEQARSARTEILRKMAAAIPEPRKNTSQYAPAILTIKIPVRKIRDVIGPGGKTIRGITDDTGARVDVSDDGSVQIAGHDMTTARQAQERIEAIAHTKLPEVGKDYHGVVKTIVDFGAFVEILPGTDGLLHISEIADRHVNSVRDELQVGDEVEVRVIEVDGNGRTRLSCKDIIRERAGLPPLQRRPRGGRGGPGRGGPGRGGPGRGGPGRGGPGRGRGGPPRGRGGPGRGGHHHGGGGHHRGRR